MKFFKRLALKLLIKYVANYLKEGVRNMGDISSKKGVKSSEFFLTLIGAMIPIINKFFNLDLPTHEILSILGIILAYVGSRTILKKSGQA